MWITTGFGSGNPYQDMLDYSYLLKNKESKMSIENEEYK
jgi:hypothetical protein